MPSIRKRQTKNGDIFYEIRCRVSRERPELTTRWYAPKGWSSRAIERELTRQAAEFERLCQSGEVLSRLEKKKQAQQAALAEAAVLTLQQYGERVFMPQKNITCSENTRASFQSMLDLHIYPVLGSYKLPEVNSSMLTKLLLDFQSTGKSHASCVKLYTVLKLLFKMAYLGDSIDHNPMDKVQRPKPRKDEIKRSEVDFFTAEELRYILECLEKEPLKWRALIRLLISTGIRRAEVTGLQWRYVDFENNRITIAAELCYTAARGTFLDTPKNSRIRTINVDPAVMDLLKQLQAGNNSDFVFTQEGSTEPMNPQTPEHYMRGFSKKYGVEKMHPHKLRHSFASLAITNGADVVSVSEILGHASPAVTLSVYSHASEESKLRAINTFHAALRENPIKK